MVRYIAMRLGALSFVAVGATMVVFLILHLIPGDPIDMMFHNWPNPTPEQRAAVRRDLGLDKPLYEQYVLFLWRALHADLGRSIRMRRPVLSEIVSRLPNTVKLTVFSLFLSAVLGTSAGVLSAAMRGTAVDTLSMVLAVLGLAVPSFWLGLMLISVFALRLDWFPATGADGIRSLMLPSITLAALGSSIIARMTRSAMLEVIGQAYVITARAKGLTRAAVILRHAFRNAMIPTITIVGLQAGSLLSGAFIVESVFAYPGLGQMTVQAILNRDLPLVQGAVLVTALIYVLVNLLVDIAYAYLDPRITYA